MITYEQANAVRVEYHVNQLLYPNLGGLGWHRIATFRDRLSARRKVNAMIAEGEEKRRLKIEMRRVV